MRAGNYNVAVPQSAEPRSITRTETIGVVIVAAIILMVLLLRWGSVIAWSAR